MTDTSAAAFIAVFRAPTVPERDKGKKARPLSPPSRALHRISVAKARRH
jgi:hypothetical protein